MRPSILKFAEWAVQEFPVSEPVIEFGALQVQENGMLCNVKHLFPNKKYIGADMRDGPGVDKVLNLHQIGLDDNSMGTVILLDTLEHVEYPYKAMDEVYRILKPGGIVILSSCMNFPIHSYPHDYWRFTPQAFSSLLQNFGHSWTGFQGDKMFPYSIFGIGQKDPINSKVFHKIDDKFSQLHFPFEFYQFILNLAPPFILSMYRKFKNKK